MLLSSWIMFCLRAFVATIFITYACSKLLNLSAFATTIRRHRLIPDSLSSIAAKVLSVVELALGLLFLFNIFPLIVGLAISILLVGLSGILLRARFTPGLGIQDCGCSGTNKKKTPIGSALFRNALLISASIVTMVVVGMHRNISLSLSPLIEAILLLCIVAGIFCMRSGLFSSLSNILNIETNNRDGRISTGRDGNRRSFIKWGVASLIGLSTFLSITPLASAAVIVPCDNGAACGCGGYSRIWNNCADIIGDSGTEYESFYTKCCDKTNQTCRYVTVELGYINCGGC
jgi:uncharacterized membrane protein YphA (DoxX/SURF4 family)